MPTPATSRDTVKRLVLKNFTVFNDVDIRFSPNLNVIVGENGTGKTHLLKVVYALLAVNAPPPARAIASQPAKTQMQAALAEKLTNVFRAESLGRLARRKQGVQRCEIFLTMTRKHQATECSFSTRSKTEVTLLQTPDKRLDAAPAYIPTRELLTIYPNFVAIYERTALEFDETWRDTCLLLGLPPRRGPRSPNVADLLTPLEQAMEGTVEYDPSGRFYLRPTSGGRIEMPLVAEGLRKLGMIAQLVATGALLGNGFLFWDEPESKLNPVLIARVAGTIVGLCRNGIQVFVATHSLFLLRELAILMEQPSLGDLAPCFIGLNRGTDGVALQQGDSLEDIGPLAALDEEMAQSDRYIALGA